MKRETIEKRMSRYEGSKNAIAYRLLKKVVDGETKIRPCYTSGKGRFTTNHDHTGDFIALLKMVGIKYTLTNDAPRGSATGNLITIKTKISG